MKKGNENRTWFGGLAVVAVLLFAAAVVAPVAASEISPYCNVNISVENIQYNDTSKGDAGDGTYNFWVGRCSATGGLNAFHITNSTDMVSATNGTLDHLENPGLPASGTFYLSDTGGRGYEDEAILLIAVSGASEEDPFSITINASGYHWVPNATGSAPIESEAIASGYIPGSHIGTYTEANYVKFYGETVAQNWRPSGNTLAGYPLFSQESLANEPANYHLIFVDLNVSVLGTNIYNSSFRNSMTDQGMPKITYTINTISNSSEPVRVAFDAYAWIQGPNGGFERRIGWTNKMNAAGETGTKTSGWDVLFT